MSLLKTRSYYKPFEYPWAYTAWDTQQKIHWIPEEVPMSGDVQDWKNNLDPKEKNLLTQIFRFFTQADIEVHDCYMNNYASVFKPTEICMMLTAFANMETVHIAAYSYLLDTVGMPEIEYQAFMQYKEMQDKCDFLGSCNVEDKFSIARTLAIYGAFTEGLQLFASFAILLNFPRFNKMKGMGQIITWSVRDETLHVEYIIRLWKTFVKEENLWSHALQEEIINACRTIVRQEDKFIDLVFELGGVQGLEPEEVKKYVRYIANIRLIQLGLKPIYQEEVDNPLPWIQHILNAVEHANFFENRATEYSRAATQGSWEEVF